MGGLILDTILIGAIAYLLSSGRPALASQPAAERAEALLPASCAQQQGPGAPESNPETHPSQEHVPLLAHAPHGRSPLC